MFVVPHYQIDKSVATKAIYRLHNHIFIVSFLLYLLYSLSMSLKHLFKLKLSLPIISVILSQNAIFTVPNLSLISLKHLMSFVIMHPKYLNRSTSSIRYPFNAIFVFFVCLFLRHHYFCFLIFILIPYFSVIALRFIISSCKPFLS